VGTSIRLAAELLLYPGLEVGAPESAHLHIVVAGPLSLGLTEMLADVVAVGQVQHQIVTTRRPGGVQHVAAWAVGDPGLVSCVVEILAEDRDFRPSTLEVLPNPQQGESPGLAGGPSIRPAPREKLVLTQSREIVANDHGVENGNEAGAFAVQDLRGRGEQH